jgi:5-methylcytosine-specific restriction endonuclease McrA
LVARRTVKAHIPGGDGQVLRGQHERRSQVQCIETAQLCRERQLCGVLGQVGGELDVDDEGDR